MCKGRIHRETSLVARDSYGSIADGLLFVKSLQDPTGASDVTSGAIWRTEVTCRAPPDENSILVRGQWVRRSNWRSVLSPAGRGGSLPVESRPSKCELRLATTCCPGRKETARGFSPFKRASPCETQPEARRQWPAIEPPSLDLPPRRRER